MEDAGQDDEAHMSGLFLLAFALEGSARDCDGTAGRGFCLSINTGFVLNASGVPFVLPIFCEEGLPCTQ